MNFVGDKYIGLYGFKILIFNGMIEKEIPNIVGDNQEKVVEGCLRRIFVDLINRVIYGHYSILSPTDLEDYDKN